MAILEQFSYSMTSITYLQEKVWPVGCSSWLRADYLGGSDLWEGQTKNEVDGHLRLQGLEIPGEPQAPGFPESLPLDLSLLFLSVLPEDLVSFHKQIPPPRADPGRGVPGTGGVGDPFPRHGKVKQGSAPLRP